MEYRNNRNRFQRLPEMLLAMILLGFFWLLTSLGIVTVGAATAALNESMRAVMTDGEKKPLPLFFRAFREHFALATKVWLLHLLAIAILALDLLYYSAGSSTLDTLAMTAICVLATILVFEMSVVFACMVQNHPKTVRACFSQAFDLAFRCFWDSVQLLIIAAAVLMAGIFLFHGILPFAAGIIACAHWKLLPQILRKARFRRPVRQEQNNNPQ